MDLAASAKALTRICHEYRQWQRTANSWAFAALQRRNALRLFPVRLEDCGGLGRCWDARYRVARLPGQAWHRGGRSAPRRHGGPPAEARVQETGVRNGAYGADKFGFKDLAGVQLESDRSPALRARHPQRRGDHRRRRRALRRNRTSHRPLAQGQAHRGRCDDRKHRVVGRQSQAEQRALRQSAGGFPRPRQGQDAVRAGSLWRRRSEIPHQGPRLHRIRLAFAVHPPAPDPPRARRSSRAMFPT